MLWAYGALTSSSCRQLKLVRRVSEGLYPIRAHFPQNPTKGLTLAIVRNLKSSGVNPILQLYLAYGITTYSKVYHNMQHCVARIQYVFIKQTNRAESQKALSDLTHWILKGYIHMGIHTYIWKFWFW